MEVTEVRIRLVENDNAEKLCAFATITLDREFVVRDMKIIDGNNGIFVAMPSRRVMVRCKKCGSKNAARTNFCNDCGCKLPVATHDPHDGHSKVHVDVAHPVTSNCRERIHCAVLKAFHDAKKRKTEIAAGEQTAVTTGSGSESGHVGEWHIFS